MNDELELEPNNTPAQAHLLTLPARIRGDNIGEAFYGGFYEVLAAPTVAEVEPNDSQFAAQVITLPAVIQGTVAKGDSAALVTLSGIASPYTTTIEDWYAWQNDPQELRFSLSYSADSGADLDLFVFFGSGEVQALSNKDNVAANDFTEEAILNAVRQTSGTYQVVVDAWDSAGPVDYQLIVQSGAFGGQANVEIMDWYRVELSASASINASITGGASLVLTSAGGDPVLAVSHPATPGANVNLNSGPLAAGSYLIGVSVTDTAYKLHIAAQ